jgi:hypothetical protein
MGQNTNALPENPHPIPPQAEMREVCILSGQRSWRFKTNVWSTDKSASLETQH